MLLFYHSALAQIPAPQINLSGNIGAQGFPVLNSGTLIFASDANHTLTAQESSATGGIKITSGVSLTATRNLILPTSYGKLQFVSIENATTGGQSIQVIGQSGTGITIPNGQVATGVWFDGTNVTGTLASGGFTNPMTTAGDMIVGGSGGNPQRLPIGSNGQVLGVVSGAPGWTAGGGNVTETRLLHVSTLESQSVGAGATQTIFSASGAGSVERIQFANIGDPASWQTSTLTITVDSRVYTVPLGIFFLNYGYDQTTPNSQNFATKNLAISAASPVNINTTWPATPASTCCAYNSPEFGGYRKIYIPYTSSISIVYTNASSNGTGIFTQVDYYPGTSPPGLHPATQNVFRMYVSPVLGTTVAYGTMQWLPTVTGAGQLESVYVYIQGIQTGATTGNGGLPTWLEGDPTIAVDSTTYQYGGTEDFFGCQFYCTGYETRVDEYGVGILGSALASTTSMTSFYRYFQQFPMIFSSSIAISSENGQSGQGAYGPPSVQWTSLVVYYTTT